MLMHILPAVLEVSVQQYVFMSADEASFSEGLSFYAYRIYLREFTRVLKKNLCESYFSAVNKGSPYLPAAIVRIHSCLELAPTHMSSPSSHWQHSVSFSAVVCL